MLRKLYCLLPLVVILLAVAATLRCQAQTTIYVYGANPPYPTYPYRTIQSGIDAASNGDTVLVEPIPQGAYNETIDFKGKAITVTGLAAGTGPTADLPVIQSSGVGPSVVFQTGETSSSVFSYFNIQGGGTDPLSEPFVPGQYTSLSGAIYVNGSSPSILYNTLSQSACWGIYVDDGSPLIQGNTISSTTAIFNGLNDCGRFSGQAISIQSGSTAPTRVIDNILENNVQVGTWVGIGYVDTGPGGGGAISVNAPAILENNIIRDNNANASWGGGINIEGGPVFIVQNLIYGNSSNCGGGAIALPQQGVGPDIVVLIANNTMVDNLSGPNYGTTCPPSTEIFSSPEDVFDDPGPNVVVVNNILSGSTADPDIDCAPALAPIVVPNEAYQSIFDHNILRNAGGSFFGQYCVDVTSKYGNLTLDPQFNNPSAGDYSLTRNSPAIDAGNTSALQLFHQLAGVQLTTDIDDNPRVIDYKGNGYPIIDIGAYEYPDQPVTAPTLPTTMVLSFESSSFHYTLTATTQSPLGVPVGDVSFFVDGAPLGSAEINASGIATLSGFPLTAGTHALSATYPGHDAFTPGIAIINIVNIPLVNTDVLLYAVPTQASFGTPIVFTVNATAADGSVPSPITLTDIFKNTQTLLTTLHPDASGTATYTTSALAEGSHEIQAAYAQTPIYSAAGDSVLVTITGYDTTLKLNCGPTEVPVGTPVSLVATVSTVVPANGPPIGAVDFKQGTADLGQSTLMKGVANFNTVTVAGTNSFTANFDPQNGFNSSSATCYVGSPALTISSSANPTPAYTPITFTANLATTAPAGSYSLIIGSNPPVAMTASPSGSVATYTTAGLAQGIYDVTATFTPANNSAAYVANLEPPQVVTVAIGDFRLIGPSSVTARTESSASGSLSLASINNFQGAVALSCNLPLPTTYTCAISPVSVPLVVGGTGSATVTLSPSLNRAANEGVSRIVFASLFPLTLISLAGLARRRGVAGLLPLVILALLAASTTACGKDIAYPATPPGSYPFTVTATGTTKGGVAPVAHTVSITLVLTP